MAKRTRTDLDEISFGIGDEDQILRGFENPPPLLDFLIQRLARSLALADVARNLRGADNLAG